MVTNPRPKDNLKLTLRLRSQLSLRLPLNLRPKLILAQRSTQKLRLIPMLRLRLELKLAPRLEPMLRQVGVILAGTERWQLSRDTVLLRLALELQLKEGQSFVADKSVGAVLWQLGKHMLAELQLQELLEHDRFV